MLAIVLPDIFIFLHYARRRYLIKPWQQWLWWVPCVVMVLYTLALNHIRSFAPSNLKWLNLYLVLLGTIVAPKAIFTFCSFIGWLVRRALHKRRNYGHVTGLVLSIIAVAYYAYGLTFGVARIKVRHVHVYYANLPKAFDGYRIAQISDVHCGTFQGWRRGILRHEIDSVRRQHANLVVMTGDMQNLRPGEVARLMPILRRLPYTYFVLGNHDYAEYVKVPLQKEREMRARLLKLEGELGSTLCNTAVPLTRGRDTLWLAGEENDGLPPFPNHANLHKTLSKVPPHGFVVMLQHDPTAWTRHLLHDPRVWLTLSGHTHGGQMQVLGWRPSMLSTHYDLGLFCRNGRYLYVNAGLGGLVPFRLNMPNEVTVITLHKKTNNK